MEPYGRGAEAEFSKQKALNIKVCWILDEPRYVRKFMVHNKQTNLAINQNSEFSGSKYKRAIE